MDSVKNDKNIAFALLKIKDQMLEALEEKAFSEKQSGIITTEHEILLFEHSNKDGIEGIVVKGMAQYDITYFDYPAVNDNQGWSDGDAELIDYSLKVESY